MIPLNEDRPLWLQQCDAAREIRERFGTNKALGYLVGEKLRLFLRQSDRRDLGTELSRFVAEIKDIFEPEEIGEYLSGVRRLGALGHVVNDEDFGILRAAGAGEEDVVTAAEDVLLIEDMKILLLGHR